MNKKDFITLNSTKKFVFLFTAEIIMGFIQFITDCPLLELSLTIFLVFSLDMSLLHSCYGISYSYRNRRSFYIFCFLICALLSLTFDQIKLLQIILTIIMISSITSSKQKLSYGTQTTQNVSPVRSPTHRKSSLSTVLNDNEKWLDLLDQGYFLCDKITKLIYTNKKANQLDRKSVV